MIKVFVQVDGAMHYAEISSETHTILRDGAYLRNHPLDYYLVQIIKEYGELNEENILKYIDEKWVL